MPVRVSEKPSTQVGDKSTKATGKVAAPLSDSATWAALCGRRNTVGMISAIAAGRGDRQVRASRLNRCSLYGTAPHKIDSPSTSRMLPIIKPAIDATTPVRPRRAQLRRDQFRCVPERGIQ